LFSKKLLISLLLSLGVCLLAGTFFVSSAQAQDVPPPPDTGCLACHENLYYQYDTGKWFCQCSKEMSCTCCHGGNAMALTEKEAHAGMQKFPTQQNAESCRKCHVSDYKTRVELFNRTAGSSPVHPVPATSGPVTFHETGNQPAAESTSRLLQPWRLAGLSLLGVALLAVGLFGYRCWRADCLAKIKK
jgi:hypothetical protein